MAILSRVGFISEPWMNDAGLYISMGKVLAEGQAGLYRVVWDTKFPSVALLVEPFWLLFGRAWWGYVLAQGALAFGASFLFARAARSRIGPHAYWPVLLTSLVYLNLSRVVLTGFQLETLMAVFSTVAACCVLYAVPSSVLTTGEEFEQSSRFRTVGWWFMAGVFAGLAALAKPTGLAVAGAGGVAALWPVLAGGGRQRRHGAMADAAIGVAALACGVAAVVVPVIVWAMTAPFAGELPEVYRQIVLYGTGTPWRQVFSLKAALLFALALVPVAVRLAHWYLPRRRPEVSDQGGEPTQPLGARPAILAFALAWLAAEVVGVVIQKRLYAYHFLPIFPPAALLCGLVPVRPKPLVMTAAVLPAMALSLAAAWPMLRDLGGPVPMAKVIAYLDEHAKPGESVWADPSPHLTIPTGLRPGMRYVFTHYFINSDAAPAEFSSRMIADLKTRRPEWAVVMASPGLERKHAELESQPGLALNPQRRRDVRAAFATVMNYIESHYERVDELDGFRILRRKGE